MSRDSETSDDYGLARRTFLGAAGAAGAAAAVPAVGAAATAPRAKVASGIDLSGGAQEVLVVFDSNASVTQLSRFDLAEGFHQFEVLPIGYTVATGEQVDRIAALDSVLRVEPNAELEFHNADAREVTGVETLHTAETPNRGDNAHVAVIDSGLSGLHPDHQQNVRHNYKYQNPLSRDTAWVDVGVADTDDNGHGTHTSGSVAGDGTIGETTGLPEGENQRGMAPEASLTVYSTGLTLLVVNTIAAFDHLLANHVAGAENLASEDDIVHVTNNSYGPTAGNDADFSPLSAMNVATYRTFEAGILHCFSAGNSGPGTNTYSEYGKAPWVVGVAATGDDRTLTSFSSRGRMESFDGETNRDRDLALANVRELYASTFGGSADRTSTGQTGSFGSASPAAGAVVVGLNQTTDTFTVEPVEEAPDRYEVTATLTWDPANDQGAEPNDLDFALLDSGGSVVTESGTGGSEVQDDPVETLTGVVTDGSSYNFEVTGWRGAANWTIEYEVFAVETETLSPEPPYGVYVPDVGAPGEAVVSTMGVNDPLQALGPTYGEDPTVTADPHYAAISGTSMSSPVTAGIAALGVHAYIEAHPESEPPAPNTVFEALEAGAVFDSSLGHTDVKIGKGFVEAPKVVAAAEAAAQLDAPDDGDDGTENVAPTIDRFEVTEARKPDPHVDISVDYAVSDDDGDLASLTLELFDSSDTSIETIEPSVSGSSAAGTADFERHRGDDGETYDVVATVTDGAGASTTETKNVTEDDDRGRN